CGGHLHTLLPLRSTSLPTAAITNRWAPVRYVVSLKGDMFKRERAGLHLALERCSSSCPCPSLSSLQAAIILSPCRCKMCIMSTPMTNGYYPRESKGTLSMAEPTQELIVSALRRRVRVSMAELTQVLGVQFASVL